MVRHSGIGNPGSPGKWPLKWGGRERKKERDRETDTSSDQCSYVQFEQQLRDDTLSEYVVSTPSVIVQNRCRTL